MSDVVVPLRPGVNLRLRDRTGGVSPSGGMSKVQTMITNLLQVPAIRDLLTIGVKNPAGLNNSKNSLTINVYDRPHPLSDSGFPILGAHYDPNTNSINVNLYDFGYLVVPMAVSSGSRLIAPYINVPAAKGGGYTTVRNAEFDRYLSVNPALQTQYNASDGNFAIVIDRSNGIVSGTSKWLTPLDPETIIAHEIGHSGDALQARARVGQEGVALVLERVVGGGRSQAGAVADVYASAFDIRNMSSTLFNGQSAASLHADVNAARATLGDTEIFVGGATTYTLKDFYRDVDRLKLEFRNRPSSSGVERVVSLTDNTSGEIILEAPASAAAGELGLIIGSTLGKYIGGSNPLVNIATTTILGTIVQNFSQAISASINAGAGNQAVVKAGIGNVKVVAEDVLDDLGPELIANLRSAAVGATSSLLSLELGRVIGVNGFGGELLNLGTGSVISKVLDNAITLANGGPAAAALNGNLFSGLSGSSLFGSVDAAGHISGGLVTSALAGFLGAKLGSLIISPTNTAGAVLSSIGSAVGAAAGTTGSFLAINVLTKLGWFGGPLVGSFVGFVLGALLGKLFGGKPPRPPSASQEIQLNITSGYWELGASQVFRAGNLELAKSMALSAEKTINGLISLTVGGVDIAPNANSSQPRQRYRVTSGSATPIEVHTWTGYAWSSTALYAGQQADAAVEAGVLRGIRDTRIMGGDILIKRAIYGPQQLYASNADDLVTLMGDLQIAEDLKEYLKNPEAINNIIASQPNSSFAANWMVTLLRAEEIGLLKSNPSDFFGGAGGFLRSFDWSTGEMPFENVAIRLNNGMQFTQSGSTTGIFSTMPARPDQTTPGIVAGQSGAWNSGFNYSIANPADVAYTAWAGQATAGNDIWDASGGGPVTMDDTGTQYYGYWDPYYGYYYQYPVTVSGGDDIFIGSVYNDVLYGRAGWDWLDGGAGYDTIDGGDNDDIILGGSGNDRLLGGSGKDYIAGGDGDDYFFDASQTWGLYGGDGDDVLVGGAGMDSLYGENGDDTIIIDQDGGGVWDAHNGQAGSDTISYERFTGGIYVDFAVLGGWSWDPSAKYIYGDAISGVENVTGSQYGDTIYGDSGGNVLTGLSGDDYLDGRDGDDTIEGGEGADAIRGGNGFDFASYRTSKQGVVVDLAAGLALGGDAAGDSYDSIEGVSGSNNGDDIAGTAGYNILYGLRGDDNFHLTAGNDYIEGGEGLDSIDASASAGAVSIYYDEGYYDPYWGYYTPGAGWIASTVEGTTTFNSIEGFIGGSFADYLSGSGAEEVFDGGAGNDYIYGGGGSDTFLFGRGDGQDTVYSSSAGVSAILLKGPIDWRDVSVTGANYSQNWGNLVVGIRGTSDQIVVGSNFSYVNSGNNAGNHNHSIKSLDLAGLSAVDIDRIDWTPYAADDNSTVVYGAQNRADLIFAYAGDDTIYTAGNSTNYETRGNVIYAGDGTDAIYSSYGDDQFIFERGNGYDTLVDAGGRDTVIMGPSVAAEDVIYEVITTAGTSGDYGSAADLYIGIRDPNNPEAPASQIADRIRVVGGGTKFVGVMYGSESYNTVEQVRVGGEEIDLTRASINWTVSYYYDGGWYYPIALDLDGDGIELRSVEGSRVASVEADGTVTRVGWLGQDDGFLALDRDGNGIIDRIGEISFVGDVAGAKTDLEGLAAYDSNGDGKLDSADARWGEFRVWQDKNQDGFGSQDELISLHKAGVASISLKGQLTGFTTADGPDNTVLATTDIAWTDADRTGSAYDVALARLQVRTDDAAGALASRDAAARGTTIDDIEARLRGIQTLTDEQVAAIREKKVQSSKGEGGLFYRVEDLLGSGSTNIVDGLLTVDPKLAGKIADGSRTLGLLDRYADSEWTKLGRTDPGEADMRGTDVQAVKAELSDAQKAAIAEARKIVADRALADEAKATAVAARDAVDAAMGAAPAPPTEAELQELKRRDAFKLLQGADDAAADQQAAAEIVRRLITKQMRLDDDVSIATDDTEYGMPASPAAEEAAATRSAGSAPGQPIDAAPGSQGESENMVTDSDGYGVIIRTANARLVQSLASFGDAPAMMASYQGLNVANDPQAAWLSVDAMPSVQRLAAIR